MSNFRLKGPDAVFIHIPKTGGTSIRRGAWADNYEGPVFGHIPEEWQSLFKFAFVRHPCDRLISAWKMFAEGAYSSKGDYLLGTIANAVGLQSLRRKYVKGKPEAHGISLKDFLSIVEDNDIDYDVAAGTKDSVEVRIRHHTIPQTHPYNCLAHANFIGRYESIEQDFRKVASRLELLVHLPHMRRTIRESWRESMDAHDIDRCYAFYRDDFRELGYSLGAEPS
jgi:hypothetical protein